MTQINADIKDRPELICVYLRYLRFVLDGMIHG